jgi:hypothetical protein
MGAEQQTLGLCIPVVVFALNAVNPGTHESKHGVSDVVPRTQMQGPQRAISVHHHWEI